MVRDGQTDSEGGRERDGSRAREKVVGRRGLMVMASPSLPKGAPRDGGSNPCGE